MEVHVLLFRHLSTVLHLRPISAFSELDNIQYIERQACYLYQSPRQRRFAATGIAKHGNFSHGTPKQSPFSKSRERNEDESEISSDQINASRYHLLVRAALP